ncbi:unnamed protein product [Caenorhabditis auriculariae]|uniref:Death domain-containing protein n=1 Tax=Caenorhabditis auriculariae TaxID=2777116 RepID=A0A8S1HKI6_9PELO|nr:unnamed protein product [Caenorhabditis auriculariae]
MSAAWELCKHSTVCETPRPPPLLYTEPRLWLAIRFISHTFRISNSFILSYTYPPKALMTAEETDGSLKRSQSDSQVIVPQIQKSQSMRRLLIDELSSGEAFAGDRLWALLSGSGDTKVEVRLIGDSFEVPAIDVTKKEGLVIFTMPCLPCSTDIEVQLKISLGEDVSTHLPLNYRVKVGRARSAETLLVDNLFEFASSGEAIALLQPFAKLIKQLDVEGNNVLHVAARNGQSFALKLFLSVLPGEEKNETLNQQNQRGLTALHCAIRSGDPDAVHYLMNHGALTNISDSHGNTAVHYLSDAYNESIFKEILEPSRGQQTDLESQNDVGLRPLHIAVKRLKLTLIEMLLEAGADIEARDKNEKTALLHATTMNDVEIIQLLLQRNADSNVEDDVGETPLSMAARNANYPVLGLLLDRSADPRRKNAKGVALIDNDETTVQNVINGERMELPQKDIGAAVPHDLATSRSPLFGRSHPDNAPREEALRNRVVVRTREEILNDAESLLREPMPTSHQGYFDDEEMLPGPSTSSGGSRSSRRTNHSAQKLKDDVSNLDYLTRLRVSKIFDVSSKWQRLAEELECGHMVELISICSDDSGESSSTMIFLDQFEQMPEASITRLREAIIRLGEDEAAQLIDQRFVY